MPCATTSRGASSSNEPLPVGVVQGGAVSPGRLREGVAGEGLGPHRAGRVLLPGVELAPLGAQLERQPQHLGRRVGVVGAPQAERVGLAPQPAAGGQHHGLRAHRAPGAVAPRGHGGDPAVAVGGQAHEARRLPHLGAARAHGRTEGADHLCSGALTGLQEALPARPAAAQQAQLPVVTAERHPQRLEPSDGVGTTVGQAAHQLRPRRMMPGGEGVLEVGLGGVVLAERRLDAALGPAGVAGPQGRLGGHQHGGAGLAGADRRRHPGAAGTHHEHVGARLCRFRHPRTLANSRRCFQ